MVKDINIADYSYPLPDERIAKFPVAQRDHSKLLIYKKGEITEDHFYNLPSYLPEGALMVMNNTRVIQARLHFRKPTGALIEVFLLEPAQPRDYEQMFQTRGSCSWLCLIGNRKKWKDGTLTLTHGTLNISATQLGEQGTSQVVGFEWTNTDGQTPPSFAEVIDTIGELPIPPYLNRHTQESDKSTYQTVYSKIKGSVAAPTAGLHFTPDVLRRVKERSIECDEVTLHVGAGTFRPVKSTTIGQHPMHTEYIAVGRHTLQRLLAHHCKAIAVGTTSVRTLESLYYLGCKIIRQPDISEEQMHVDQWEPYTPQPSPRSTQPSPPALQPTVEQAIEAILSWLQRHNEPTLHASTQIIIAPGYDYKIVNKLITNFHQPQSTLLLLVSAFVGGNWRQIYNYALNHDFRFLSYGDSSLLEGKEP